MSVISLLCCAKNWNTKCILCKTPLKISIIDHALYHAARKIISRSAEAYNKTTWLAHIKAKKLPIINFSRQKKATLLGNGMEYSAPYGSLVWHSGSGAVNHTLNPRLFSEQLIYLLITEDKILMVDRSSAIIEKNGQLPISETVIVLTNKENMQAK